MKVILVVIVLSMIDVVFARDTIATQENDVTIYDKESEIVYVSTNVSSVYKFLDTHVYKYIREPFMVLIRLFVFVVITIGVLIANIFIAVYGTIISSWYMIENLMHLIFHHMFGIEYVYREFICNFVPLNQIVKIYNEVAAAKK